ncbi:hypothetical protein, partial [Granulicella mallensis]|uniref:hypothetical protein n=1 Tax=Granulicella mallensis TaxID=940614 RepID=UPI001C841A6D
RHPDTPHKSVKDVWRQCVKDVMSPYSFSPAVETTPKAALAAEGNAGARRAVQAYSSIIPSVAKATACSDF